ncbi:DUF3987 domain-containing protein [Microcoleus vaginatus]|uniref:DUF3987 domain-containing protein n=1 Tax=Microcoleus vaginatus TaxID=119532 RepID=UPI0016826C59|nr:DUF3987 domain-containing protein [Microcoleus sp. FACHB-84]MBD2008007.1 DUF3987 domain-containing protein [Microcoleus sp. FACHB-45]
MVAQFSGHTTELIKALALLPQEWVLTPVNGEKKSYLKDWQNKKLNRKTIESELKSGRAKGYGLLTGEKSGGILAIDADGPAAHELLARHGKLPQTVAFTSGREGRCQYLLRVPQEKWSLVKTTKLNTNVKDEDGKDQHLEFRWNGCQSVLPPSVHPKTGNYKWVNSPESVEIAECPDWVIEMIMNAEDAAKPEPVLPLSYAAQSHSTANRWEDISLPVPANIPLENCLATSSRDLLNGVSSGGRNDAGHKLACDLIGSANYLRSLGQSFDSDPRQMLEDFASRCSPPLPSKEVNSIWKSADRSNPSPSINQASPKALENRIKSWYWKNHQQNNRTFGSNVITHARFTPPNTEELREELTALIKAGTAGSELTETIHSLARGSNPQQIWRLYKEISEETERADQRADRKRDVENLLRISNRRLTLENYLHQNLAEPIKKISAWMGVDSEAVLTHLLPTVAGLINPNSCVIAKECINFVEPLLLYTGVVSPSGARKTPTLNIVKEPLVRLQSAEDAKHSGACQRYDAEVERLKETKGKDKGGGSELPQKPNPPREFYVDNVTVEALDKIKGQQPEHGLTLIKDELSGLFASHDAYRGGKGSDKESFLSGWNGGGVKKNRSGDGSRVSLARDSLSVTGGIQPDKLRALLGDFNDSQGQWARFLWYHMPMRKFKIPRNNVRYSLGDLLEGIYKKIDALPALKLRFDEQGQNYFDDWFDTKDEQKRAEIRPGLQAAIAKMPGQAVRLIGLLHILWEVASGSAEVPEEIPLVIVESGCQLADFYLGQVTILQGDGDVEDGEIAPTLRKLLDKLAELKTLTASQARRAIRDLRKTDSNKVRQLFVELKTMGLAETQGTGSKLALIPKELTNFEELQKHHKPYSTDLVEDSFSKELTTVDKKLTSNQWGQTIDDSGSQDIKYPTVDKVDKVETFYLSAPPPQTAEPIDIPELSGENPKMTKDVVNLSTIGTENLSQCELEAVDTPSTISVNSLESVNSPLEEPIANQTGKSKPEIKIGDRVVIARSDSPRYRGVKGEVIDDNIWGANGLEFHIRFDKKISNILQDYFPATDVMREPC